MKKLILYILLLSFNLNHAQKMGYVDTKLILKQMPQYQQSEQRLNAEVKRWQDEIKSRQSGLEKMRVEYENEKVLLTDEQKKTKMQVIDSTEKVLNEFIEKKFGTDGESTSLRYNLIKPLQDQIWNTINSIAAKDRYNFIFDKSSDLIMIFTDSKYDITDKVIKQLGGVSVEADKDTRSSNSKTTAGTGSSSTKTSAAKNNTKAAEAQKDTAKPKTGYGSKYVPKKKSAENTTEGVNDSESGNTAKEAEATTQAAGNKISTSATTEEKPKSGYGSKYVPKKKETPGTTAEEVKKQGTTTQPASTKTEEKTKTSATATSNNKTKQVTATEEKPKAGYGSKYAPKKKETNKTEDAKTSIEEDNTQSEEIKATESTTTGTKPKSGYGSKYVPKKKTQDNQ